MCGYVCMDTYAWVRMFVCACGYVRKCRYAHTFGEEKISKRSHRLFRAMGRQTGKGLCVRVASESFRGSAPANIHWPQSRFLAISVKCTGPWCDDSRTCCGCNKRASTLAASKTSATRRFHSSNDRTLMRICLRSCRRCLWAQADSIYDRCTRQLASILGRYCLSLYRESSAMSLQCVSIQFWG